MPIFNGVIAKFNGAVLAAAFVSLTPLLLPIWGGKANSGANTAGARLSSPYITLVTAEDTGDRLVSEKLNAAGIDNVLSESSQWFFLNDFSELRRVALDEFSAVMLETDPRNDGYAQKLKTLFVRDGRRYFYIPTASFHSLFSAGPDAIEQRVKNALRDIRYNIVFTASYARGTNNITLYIAAALFSLVFAFFVSKPASKVRSAGALLTLSTAAFLPACGLLAGQGPAGFALSSVMLVMFLSLLPQLEYFFTKFRRLRFNGGGSLPACYAVYIKQFPQKEKKFFFFLLVLILAVCTAGRLNIFRVLCAFLFFCLSAAAQAFAMTARRGYNNHVVFIPVEIRPRGAEKRRLIIAALPFMLVSAGALFAPFFYSPRADFQAQPVIFDTKAKSYVPAIGAEDYDAHVSFQKNFTIKKLTRAVPETRPSSPAEVNGNGAYINFEPGGDGLLRPVADGAVLSAGIEKTITDIPPFPLENLIAFLNGGSVGGNDVFTRQNFDFRALIAVLAALALYIPGLASASGNRKKVRNTLYMTQSVTA